MSDLDSRPESAPRARRRAEDRWYLAGLCGLLLVLLASGLAAAGWPPERGHATNNSLLDWPGVDGSAVPAWSVKLSEQVVAGPVVDGSGRIFIGVGEKVLCFGSNGEKLWTAQVGPVGLGCLGVGDPDGDQCTALYVGTRSPRPRLVCLSTATGDVLWTTPLQSEPSCPPLAVAGRVYLGTEDGIVAGYSDDGSRLWTYAMGNPIRYRMSHGAGQCLYAADNTGYVVALDALDGSLKLRKYTGAPFRSPPVLGPDGSLFFGTLSGYVRRLDSNLSILWAEPLRCPAGPPAVLADGSSVYSRSDGQVSCVSAMGVLQWTGGVCGKSQPQLQPVVDSLGTIHAASGCRVTGIDGSGSTTWVLDLGAHAITAMAVPFPGSLLVATEEPRLMLYAVPEPGEDQGWRPEFEVSQPDGSNGWYISAPVVSLTPMSLSSRPANTQVNWQVAAGGEVAQSGTLGPVDSELTVAGVEGELGIAFTGTEGQAWLVGPLSLCVDRTPPRIGFANLPLSGGFVAAGTFTPQVVASDRHSGVDSVLTYLDGDLYAGSCELTPGEHTLSITATDRAGNTASAEVCFQAASDRCSALSLNPVVVGVNAERVPVWSRWVTVLVRVPAAYEDAISMPQLGGVGGAVAARLPFRASTGYRAYLVRFPREPVAAALAARIDPTGNSLRLVTLALGLQCGDQALAAPVSILFRP